MWTELARRRIPSSIFLTPEWIEVARAHDTREQLTLAIGGSAIAALAREADGTLTFAGGELTDEQDLIAEPPHEREAAESLGLWIADQGVARALLSYVPEDSPTGDVLASLLAGRGYRTHVARLVTSPRLDLPGDFATHVQSLTKKERHELRRKMRRLEKARTVSFAFAAQRERAAALDRFFALHRRSRGDKAGFMTRATELFFRDIADATAARGWLRLGVLSVDGEFAAVLFGFAYEGTLAQYNSSYDPSLAQLSVGIVAHAYAIREAIAEGLTTYDLLRGNEPYKYDLGADDRWLVRIEASRR